MQTFDEAVTAADPATKEFITLLERSAKPLAEAIENIYAKRRDVQAFEMLDYLACRIGHELHQAVKHLDDDDPALLLADTIDKQLRSASTAARRFFSWVRLPVEPKGGI